MVPAEPPELARVRLHESWKSRLSDALTSPHMQALRAYLLQQREMGVRVFPPAGQMFAALDATPFEQVKVVILGQDPYHGPGQAHGLSARVIACCALRILRRCRPIADSSAAAIFLPPIAICRAEDRPPWTGGCLREVHTIMTFVR